MNSHKSKASARWLASYTARIEHLFGSQRWAEESGQVLPMTVLLILPLLVVSAFAVDVGGMYLQSQTLQSSADLAALAGAEARGKGEAEYVMRDAVDSVLVSNGVDLDTVQRDVSIDEMGDVVVRLSEDYVPVALGSLIMDSILLTRDSTAAVGACLGSCGQPFVLQPPIKSFPAQSSGDGYEPLFVSNGERVMVLNHHTRRPGPTSTTKQLACAIVKTGESCPGFPLKVDTSTSDVTRMEWYEDRDEAWFPLQQAITRADGSLATRVGFGCVDHKAAKSCGNHVLQTLEGAFTRFPSAWTSQINRVGDKLYAVTTEFSVICLDLATQAACPNYPVTPTGWGYMRKNSHLGHDPLPLPENVASMHTSDRMAPDGLAVGHRVYSIWPVDGQSRIICFDTQLARPCQYFGIKIGLTVLTQTPFLFDKIDSRGRPNKICAYGGPSEINCYWLGGGGWSSGEYMAGALPRIGAPYGANGLCGQPGTGHRCWARPQRFENRLIVASWNANAVYCADLMTGESCGYFPPQDPSIQPYSFAKVPGKDCLLGVGHFPRFFATGLDLGPCPAGAGSMELLPCSCDDGSFYWGSLDLGTEVFGVLDSFVVSVRDPAGRVVAGPIDMIAEGGRLSLSHVDPSVPKLTVSYNAEVNPDHDWLEPIEGELTVTERPALVD